jgi:hypothetical protein
MKTCIKCKGTKSIDLFYIANSNNDGRNNKCKECIKHYQKERIKSLDDHTIKNLHKRIAESQRIRRTTILKQEYDTESKRAIISKYKWWT